MPSRRFPSPRTGPVLLLAVAAAALPATVSAQGWKEALDVFQRALGNSASSSGAAGSAGTGAIAALSDTEIATALRTALAQGTRTAVSTLGRTDGFWANLAARIPLPPAVQRTERTLQKLGFGSLTNSFHLTLNRAAEQAVPVAADVFADAVNRLTLADVRGLLTGGPDAATQYFRRQSSDTLALRFRPLVARATAQAGVAATYKQLTARAGPLAAAFGAPSDLDGYVTQKALDALFVQVAAEEARIRANPAARGTEILRRVFGAR